jgi:hypothetical protein
MTKSIALHLTNNRNIAHNATGLPHENYLPQVLQHRNAEWVSLWSLSFIQRTRLLAQVNCRDPMQRKMLIWSENGAPQIVHGENSVQKILKIRKSLAGCHIPWCIWPGQSDLPAKKNCGIALAIFKPCTLL